MIYTSYFGNIRKITKNKILVPISIARWTPHWYNGIIYDKLAPTVDILENFKRTGNIRIYTDAYRECILSNLNPKQVFSDLMDLAGDGNIPVLLCFEKPDAFCHRILVREWLSTIDGIHEFKEE